MTTHNIEKILTHGGTRHADECLAIAVLRAAGCTAPVEYTFRPSAEDLSNPKVLVLDVGRVFDPQKGNFDHHQDADLPATNVLVLRAFFPEGEQRDLVEQLLFSYVDKVDRGEIVEPTFGPPTLNALVRATNAMEEEQGIMRANVLCHSALDVAWAQAGKMVEDRKRWKSEVTAHGHYAVTQSDSPISGWKDLAEEQEVNYLVSPNLRGGWQVMSRDSERFNIPAHEAQTFRHNSGFLAVYPDRETAEAHAKELA